MCRSVQGNIRVHGLADGNFEVEQNNIKLNDVVLATVPCTYKMRTAVIGLYMAKEFWSEPRRNN
jgi:hypothetical protein